MTKEEYNELIENKGTLLQQFVRVFQSAGYNSVSLDFDKASINQFESTYIEYMERFEESLTSELDHMMLVYIGEASIFHLGGRWAYGEREGFLGHEQALVIEFNNWGGIPISPINTLKSIKRKNGDSNIWDTIEFVLNKESIQKDLMEQMRNLGKKK